jgi:hypothetical protein
MFDIPVSVCPKQPVRNSWRLKSILSPYRNRASVIIQSLIFIEFDAR